MLCDFNGEVEGKNMSEFMKIYNLRNFVKQKTCFKNPENPSCIDFILINSYRNGSLSFSQIYNYSPETVFS